MVSARSKISEPLQQQVRQRAGYLCEYCHASEQWQNELFILPLTPIGRVTIATLNLNRERVIPIRAADRDIGRHPPTEDPVQPRIAE